MPTTLQRIVGALLLGALLSAVQPAFPASKASPAWPALVRDYVAYTHVDDPLLGGSHGDAEASRHWPDHSPSAQAARQAALQRFAEGLRALPPRSLTPDDAVSHAVMTWQVDVALQALAFDEARLPFHNGEGFFTTPDTQAVVTTLVTEADAKAWLARLSGIPAYFAIETANLQRGIATGWTQPALVVQSAIAAVEAAIALPTDASPLLLPFATLPATIPVARQDALRAEARNVVDLQVRPAQRQLVDFLRTAYLPHARESLGAATLQGGGDYYAFLVRRETTTRLTPDDIHRLGIAEVTRIRGDMQAIVAEAGFRGDLRAFIDAHTHDRRFIAPDAATYAEKAGEIAKRIDYLLPRYFGLLPRLPYGVRAKPAGSDSTSDGYLAGNAATGQAGAVVYSAAAVPTSPLYSLPAWLLHEGVPGHHLQIALAAEHAGLPEFRRNSDSTAYVEGWALYAERLGMEMGVYRNADERFGRLSMEMWRACRLVMDTGLHAMGWTRDQAAACLRDNTALTAAEVDRETDRYIGWPGQALGYKIGELRIVAARRGAEAALGPRFDLRAFHDLVLGLGAVPMEVLQQEVDRWVTGLKAGVVTPAFDRPVDRPAGKPANKTVNRTAGRSTATAR